MTETEAIVPNEYVQTCGDIKEHCFTIVPAQTTSDASSRLAAMTFYLFQLYPTDKEVREVLEVCAVDIGEEGIDREYGRGIAHLLCPRVLEKEVEIVSQYTEEKKNPFTAEGGELTGTWRASNSPLEVYLPEALKETIQASYQGTANGTMRFKENEVIADMTLQAAIDAVFLLDIQATAEEVIQTEGTYTKENRTITFKEKEISFAYTATRDALFLTRSLTLHEAMQLLPNPFGELANTVVNKDLFADNPITITAKLKKALRSDFDGNDVVDFNDFLLLTAAFGSQEGDQAYNPWIDLDGDGTVSFNDFLLFAAEFGQKA